MQEHEAYPFLAKLDKASGFIVPENYFGENASKLETLDTPVLNSYKKELAFEVPQNYFEESKKHQEHTYKPIFNALKNNTLHQLEKYLE